MGKYSDFPSQTALSETKICNFHLNARRRESSSLLYGSPPRRAVRIHDLLLDRHELTWRRLLQGLIILLRDSDSVTQQCTVVCSTGVVLVSFQ